MSTPIPPGALNGGLTLTLEQNRQMREAAVKEQFPLGSYVRLKPGEAESFQADVAAKLKDRVGVIRSHQMPRGSPIVDFLPVGRRQLFTKIFSSPQSNLLVLTDEAEIEKWRTAFAETAAKAAAKKSKTMPVKKA
jgi:hypothetical protein